MRFQKSVLIFKLMILQVFKKPRYGLPHSSLDYCLDFDISGHVLWLNFFFFIVVLTWLSSWLYNIWSWLLSWLIISGLVHWFDFLLLVLFIELTFIVWSIPHNLKILNPICRHYLRSVLGDCMLTNPKQVVPKSWKFHILLSVLQYFLSLLIDFSILLSKCPYFGTSVCPDQNILSESIWFWFWLWFWFSELLALMLRDVLGRLTALQHSLQHNSPQLCWGGWPILLVRKTAGIVNSQSLLKCKFI